MVHHMQAAVGQTHSIECQAYKLEDKWLREQGESLTETFDMDLMYYFMVTTCYEP